MITRPKQKRPKTINSKLKFAYPLGVGHVVCTRAGPALDWDSRQKVTRGSWLARERSSGSEGSFCVLIFEIDVRRGANAQERGIFNGGCQVGMTMVALYIWKCSYHYIYFYFLPYEQNSSWILLPFSLSHHNAVERMEKKKKKGL
jgi:hypothetical protein